SRRPRRSPRPRPASPRPRRHRPDHQRRPCHPRRPCHLRRRAFPRLPARPRPPRLCQGRPRRRRLPSRPPSRSSPADRRAIPGPDWSTEGIPAMVAALDQVAAAGHPYKLGLFLDTTIMANADLTTPNGKAYLYANVRDFYSRIPPRHWAAIDGKPVVWLYDV